MAIDVLAIQSITVHEHVNDASAHNNVNADPDEILQHGRRVCWVLLLVVVPEEYDEDVCSVEDHYQEQRQRWSPVPVSENVDPIEVGETNENGLHEQGAKVGELEILGLQVHHEVLRLSVIPDVVIVVTLVLVHRHWIHGDNFAHNEEDNAGEDPIEEENDLNQEPCSHIIHLKVPRAVVHLHDVDDVREHEQRGGNPNRLQPLAKYVVATSLKLKDEQDNEETDEVHPLQKNEHFFLVLNCFLLIEFVSVAVASVAAMAFHA